MNKNFWLIIIIVIILLGGLWYYRGKSNQNAPNMRSSISNNNNSSKEQTAPNEEPEVQNEVDYNNDGFYPANLNVKVGDTVTFKNESSKGMWVASNPHPTHTDLPGFDALKTYNPGESYKYTFQKVGTWGYHNHLNPSQGGTITVK